MGGLKVVAVFGSMVLGQRSPGSQAEPNLATRIRIRVFNQAPAPSDRVIAAERKVSFIFQSAGVGTDWLDCSVGVSGRPAVPECEEVWRPTDLELVIIDRPTVRCSEYAMGSAKPDPKTGYATIFYQRIRKEADKRAMLESEVMSPVMAHELGHMLLRSGSHSIAGVMKARLGSAEWERAVKNNLRFTSQQASAMREEVMRLIHAHANTSALARRIAPSGALQEVE